MKMKQMPFRTDVGAVERAKYRAKMAVREIAHPKEEAPHRVQWRWASAVAVAAVVAVGVFSFVQFGDNILRLHRPLLAPTIHVLYRICYLIIFFIACLSLLCN